MICVLSGVLHGNTDQAEDNEVIIKRVDDRSEAIVKTKRVPPEQAAKAGNGSSIQKTIDSVESNTAHLASKSSGLIGEGADKTVTTVQKVSESALGRLFRFLDMFGKKEDRRKE